MLICAPSIQRPLLLEFAMTRNLSILFSAIAALALAGCGGGYIDDPTTDDTDSSQDDIVNGKVDSGHSSVGKLYESGQGICTATLIGSKTVLCAAHCIEKSASAYSFVVGGKTYPAASVTVHPGWDGSVSNGEGINDLSVIILKSAPSVTPSAIATSSPKVGTNLTLVGFGVTSENGQDYGTKRVTYNTIDKVASTKIYWTPANGVGTTCYGDSGGPAFATINGDEVQVGITSGGESPCETGYSWDTNVGLFASWISSVANGDVVTSGSSPTPPPSSDTQKPTVHISSPKSSGSVTSGKSTTVKSTITDNVGVVKGELFVDGALSQTLTASPYNFTVTLSKGTHQLRVYGYDAAGNRGQYTVNNVDAK
jgi:hypothetical protein